MNFPRKVGPDGRGGDEAHDLATPLHLCCQWAGLPIVVEALLEHGANKLFRFLKLNIIDKKIFKIQIGKKLSKLISNLKLSNLATPFHLSCN